MFDPKLAAEIAELKVSQIMETGAQAVVTACQQCVRTMTAYIRKNKMDIEVLDLTELVYRAMEPQE
jgi:heterodisulfide reductase subunit D